MKTLVYFEFKNKKTVNTRKECLHISNHTIFQRHA